MGNNVEILMFFLKDKIAELIRYIESDHPTGWKDKLLLRVVLHYCQVWHELAVSPDIGFKIEEHETRRRMFGHFCIIKF